MLLSGFFLKKKPPFAMLVMPRKLENRSKANSSAHCAQPKQGAPT
jgi:hypothetical protein